jgi:hypothetical protein
MGLWVNAVFALFLRLIIFLLSVQESADLRFDRASDWQADECTRLIDVPLIRNKNR